jgi:hypothetical protein
VVNSLSPQWKLVYQLFREQNRKLMEVAMELAVDSLPTMIRIYTIELLLYRNVD